MAADRPLLTGGRYSEMVVNTGLTFFQIPDLLIAELLADMPPNELDMDPTEIELKRNLLLTMLKKHCGYLKACVVPNQFRPVVKVNN